MAFKANYEQLSNNAVTSVGSTMDNSQTTLVVTLATAFPTEGNFRVGLQDELMLVTGVSGTTFTVVRGIEGTTAVSHNAGTEVLHVFTEGSFSQMMSDYLPLSRSAIGGSKPPLLHMSNAAGVNLSSGSFTWVNQNSATVADLTLGGMSFIIPQASGASTNLSLFKKSAPATPYKITVAVTHTSSGTVSNTTDIPWIGLMFRESATNKFIAIRQHPQPRSAVIYYTSVTTPSATLFDASVPIAQYLTYYQIEDDGTTIFFRRSNNGINWMEVHSELRGANFTTAPDEVGLALSGRWGSTIGINADHKAQVLHWSET